MAGRGVEVAEVVEVEAAEVAEVAAAVAEVVVAAPARVDDCQAGADRTAGPLQPYSSTMPVPVSCTPSVEDEPPLVVSP